MNSIFSGRKTSSSVVPSDEIRQAVENVNNKKRRSSLSKITLRKNVQYHPLNSKATVRGKEEILFVSHLMEFKVFKDSDLGAAAYAYHFEKQEISKLTPLKVLLSVLSNSSVSIVAACTTVLIASAAPFSISSMNLCWIQISVSLTLAFSGLSFIGANLIGGQLLAAITVTTRVIDRKIAAKIMLSACYKHILMVITLFNIPLAVLIILISSEVNAAVVCASLLILYIVDGTINSLSIDAMYNLFLTRTAEGKHLLNQHPDFEQKVKTPAKEVLTKILPIILAPQLVIMFEIAFSFAFDSETGTTDSSTITIALIICMSLAFRLGVKRFVRHLVLKYHTPSYIVLMTHLFLSCTLDSQIRLLVSAKLNADSHNHSFEDHVDDWITFYSAAPMAIGVVETLARIGLLLYVRFEVKNECRTDSTDLELNAFNRERGFVLQSVHAIEMHCDMHSEYVGIVLSTMINAYNGTHSVLGLIVPLLMQIMIVLLVDWTSLVAEDYLKFPIGAFAENPIFNKMAFGIDANTGIMAAAIHLIFAQLNQ